MLNLSQKSTTVKSDDKEKRVEEKQLALLNDMYSMPAYLRTNIVWKQPGLLHERMEWELASRRIMWAMTGRTPIKGAW